MGYIILYRGYTRLNLGYGMSYLGYVKVLIFVEVGPVNFRQSLLRNNDTKLAAVYDIVTAI